MTQGLFLVMSMVIMIPWEGSFVRAATRPDYCGCYKIVEGKEELKAAASCEPDDSHLCCHVRESESEDQTLCCIEPEGVDVPFLPSCHFEGWSVDELYYRLKNRPYKQMKKLPQERSPKLILFNASCVGIIIMLPMLIMITSYILLKKINHALYKRRIIKNIRSALKPNTRASLNSTDPLIDQSGTLPSKSKIFSIEGALSINDVLRSLAERKPNAPPTYENEATKSEAQVYQGASHPVPLNDIPKEEPEILIPSSRNRSNFEVESRDHQKSGKPRRQSSD